MKKKKINSKLKSFSKMGGLALLVIPTLVACATTPGSGSEGTSLEALQEQGYMEVAYNTDPPYTFSDGDDGVEGLSADIFKEAMQILEVPELRGVMVAGSDNIPGLLAKRFDTVSGSLFINPSRCEQVIFSEPYALAEWVVAVAPGNPHDIHDFESFLDNDLKVGVIGGSTEYEIASKMGIDENRIISFQDLNTAVEAANIGRVDGMIYDTVALAFTIQQVGADLDVSEGFIPVLDGVEQIGALSFPFRPADVELRDAFNVAQQELRDAGRLHEIFAEYLGEDAIGGVDRAVGLDVDELCTA